MIIYLYRLSMYIYIGIYTIIYCTHNICDPTTFSAGSAGGVDKVLAIYRKHVDRSVERSMGFASRVAVVAPRIEAQMDELKQDVEDGVEAKMWGCYPSVTWQWKIPYKWW